MLNEEYVDVRLEWTMKCLGKNVRTLRKKFGYSQADLAKLIGTSQPVIHDIERSTGYNPTIYTIIKIAFAFNLKAEDILKAKV
jgi:DNA-binding XRE family transcriptional regulator